MSSSPYIDSNLIFGKVSTQELEHTLTAEKIY